MILSYRQAELDPGLLARDKEFRVLIKQNADFSHPRRQLGFIGAGEFAPVVLADETNQPPSSRTGGQRAGDVLHQALGCASQLVAH